MQEFHSKANAVNSENTLHIAGLPMEATEQDLIFFFKEYNVKNLKIIK